MYHAPHTIHPALTTLPTTLHTTYYTRHNLYSTVQCSSQATGRTTHYRPHYSNLAPFIAPCVPHTIHQISCTGNHTLLTAQHIHLFRTTRHTTTRIPLVPLHTPHIIYRKYTPHTKHRTRHITQRLESKVSPCNRKWVIDTREDADLQRT